MFRALRKFNPFSGIFFDLRKPYYYKYAQENIPCDCPLCFCPARHKREYSFVYIREDQDIMYFDVPKCASTTIRYTLFGGNNSLSLTDPQRDIQTYLKFAFVRNPWNRMVSNWKMFTTVPFRIRQLKSMTSEDVSSFEDFVRFTTRKRNHHWQPQVLFLPEALDFVGRLESFEDDFRDLCSKIGTKPERVARENAIERLPYWEYYKPSLAELVAEIYSEDIARFGYKFGESGSGS